MVYMIQKDKVVHTVGGEVVTEYPLDNVEIGRYFREGEGLDIINIHVPLGGGKMSLERRAEMRPGARGIEVDTTVMRRDGRWQTVLADLSMPVEDVLRAQ